MWRLGRYIERADMTTRVLGVHASEPPLAATGRRRRVRRGAVDGRAPVTVGVADVPGGLPEADRRARRRAVPAVRPSLPPVGRRLPRRSACRSSACRSTRPSWVRSRRPIANSGGAVPPRTTAPHWTQRWKTSSSPCCAPRSGDARAVRRSRVTDGMDIDVGAPTGMFSPGGVDTSALMASIAGLGDLAGRQIDHDRLLAAEGAGHIVHDLPVARRWSDGGARIPAVASDPVPLVIDGDEFVAALADGAIARMRMLESILRDLHGPRSLLTDGVVDPITLWGSPKYRLAAFGTRPHRRWMTNYAVDVVRDLDGRWRVVRDITDAPAGVGYALLGRSVAARVHRDMISRLPGGRALRSLDPFADRLRDGLADVAATRNPRIVVLSGGVDHTSYVEQSYLATDWGSTSPRARISSSGSDGCGSDRCRVSSPSTSCSVVSRTTDATRWRSTPRAASACPGCCSRHDPVGWRWRTPTAAACSRTRRSASTGMRAVPGSPVVSPTTKGCGRCRSCRPRNGPRRRGRRIRVTTAENSSSGPSRCVCTSWPATRASTSSRAEALACWPRATIRCRQPWRSEGRVGGRGDVSRHRRSGPGREPLPRST